MAGDIVNLNRLDDYDDDTLKATFNDTHFTLNTLRKELLGRGFWVDAKYNITSIAELEDDHLISILKMLKNSSIRQSRYWKGLHDKTWQEFMLEHAAYVHLYDEAHQRNLPGADTLPEVR